VTSGTPGKTRSVKGQHPSSATVMRMLDEHDQKAAAAG
jgi:hypothetical protein